MESELDNKVHKLDLWEDVIHFVIQLLWKD